jgi:hypothetical protein
MTQICADEKHIQSVKICVIGGFKSFAGYGFRSSALSAGFKCNTRLSHWAALDLRSSTIW